MPITVTHSPATATGTSSVIVPHTGKREQLFIENRSPTDSVYLRFGAVADVATGIRVLPGTSFQAIIEHRWDQWLKGSVNVITAGPSVSLAIVEVTS